MRRAPEGDTGTGAARAPGGHAPRRSPLTAYPRFSQLQHFRPSVQPTHLLAAEVFCQIQENKVTSIANKIFFCRCRRRNSCVYHGRKTGTWWQGRDRRCPMSFRHGVWAAAQFQGDVLVILSFDVMNPFLRRTSVSHLVLPNRSILKSNS